MPQKKTPKSNQGDPVSLSSTHPIYQDALAPIATRVGDLLSRMTLDEKIVTGQLPLIDALVAAWLPGTEGQGVADVLFGYKKFTGRLSFTWPRGMEQIPIAYPFPQGEDAGPLFP
jgi:hypothetical protein